MVAPFPELFVPLPIDAVILALFSLAFLAFELATWPRRRAALAANAPGVRLRTYRVVITAQWAFLLLVVARWGHAGRPWSALGLALPSGWSLAASGVLIVATTLLSRAQARAFVRIPGEKRAEVRESLAPRLGDAMLILPRTAVERRWFTVVAITAGVCEELLFRGYAVWVLRPALGLWGATIGSVLLFGAAHSYQGRRGASRAGMVGAVFGALALALGSIVPGMILHAIVDIGGGAVGYALLRERPGAEHDSAATSRESARRSA